MPVPYKKHKDAYRTTHTHPNNDPRGNQHGRYVRPRQGEKPGAAPVNGATDTGNNILSTMLKLVFEKQQQRVYNAESGVLNLTEFKGIPDLKDVVGSINFNTQSFCQALCSTIKSLIVPPPSAIQLKGNGVVSFSHLATQLERADLHITLRAISLESNDIKSLDTLQELKKFTNLQELILRNNPVAERSDYRAAIKKMLPSLIGLDGESICAPPLGLPWPQVTPPGFSEAQTHVLQFIRFGLLAPLEADSTAGAPYGVDAVSDSYSKNAILTISLTSPEAAVSTPMRGGNGASNATQQRSVIRDIVSLRLKQTESNHNLLHGLKASVVACGRTKVCSQMEHWLYPKSFRVRHHLHSSPSVQFLDNTYLTEPSQTAMKVPVTIVTLHGIMAWTSTSGQGGAHSADQTTIQRNFTRVLSVMQAEAGRWLIANDMVSLYPLLHAAPTSSKGGSEAIDTDPLKECYILFDPRSDRTRAESFSRRKNVPVEVVMALCQCTGSDAELVTVLNDISGVPLSAFEHCASIAGENILESIQMCRLGNLFGMSPHSALEVLRLKNGNWNEVLEAVTRAAATGGVASQ